MSALRDKVLHVKAASQTRRHTCHWPGCEKQVPPAMWGCRDHWFALPRRIRNRLWAAYRAGQEQDLKVSEEYLAAAEEAQAWIRANAESVQRPA